MTGATAYIWLSTKGRLSVVLGAQETSTPLAGTQLQWHISELENQAEQLTLITLLTLSLGTISPPEQISLQWVKFRFTLNATKQGARLLLEFRSSTTSTLQFKLLPQFLQAFLLPILRVFLLLLL